jgi:hypothetical protein
VIIFICAEELFAEIMKSAASVQRRARTINDLCAAVGRAEANMSVVPVVAFKVIPLNMQNER